MANKYVSNEAIARHYKKDLKLMGYGPQQQKIFKSIKECKVNFYEYYISHHGKLSRLYSNNHCKNISSKTLNLLETLIREMTGIVTQEKEETPQTVKNKNRVYILGLRHYQSKL